MYITQNRLAYVEVNCSAFQIFDKGIWYLRNESFKFMSVSQVTKAFRNGNGCNLCNGWNVNLTLLVACTFEQKGNKREAPGCSSAMINYNLYIPPQDQGNKPANVLQSLFIKGRMILWEKATEKMYLYFCASPLVILRSHEHSRLDCPLHKFTKIRNSTLIIHEGFSLLLH